MPQELTSVDDISTRLGSYGLLIELSKDFSLSRPRFYGAVLKKGQYLYAGSAFGPTGIGACLGLFSVSWRWISNLRRLASSLSSTTSSTIWRTLPPMLPIKLQIHVILECYV